MKMFLQSVWDGRNKLADLPGVRRKLGDAVGADAIDPQRIERLPLCGFVRRPGDDSRANRVCSLDNFPIDGVDFLPEIFGGNSGKGGDWIDVARHFEHSSADRREDALNDLYCAMVK